MQKLIIAILFTVLFQASSFAQTVTDREIKKISDNLIEKLTSRENPVKNVFISDFTDGKVVPTELGRFLAEEFAFHLSDVDNEKVTVIDRSKLKMMMEEQGLIAENLIDPLTAIKTDKIKGMEHLLYGTIIDSGESYVIYVKLIKVETQQIVSSTRGRITKIPSLPNHSN